MTSLDPNSISLGRRGSGPPLVRLHCLGVDHHFWDFANELARDFTLISMTYPDTGAVPPGAYTEDLSAQLGNCSRGTTLRVRISRISPGLIAQQFAATKPASAIISSSSTTPRYTVSFGPMGCARRLRAGWRESAVDGLLKFGSRRNRADHGGVVTSRGAGKIIRGRLCPGLRGAGGRRPSHCSCQNRSPDPGHLRRR